MEWNKPSPTIATQFSGYGNGRFGHPDHYRAIEGAILQSFSRDYVFFDKAHPLKKRELGMYIGNAFRLNWGEQFGSASWNI